MKTGNACADYILQNGIYEYNLIRWCEQFLSPESTFVDIGAHIGTYSILLHKHCKTVHAFEAQKSTFDCLTIGICVNNAFNIETHNLALGSKEDTLTLYQVSEDGGCSSVRQEVSMNMGLPVTDTETVKVKTLDSFNLKNVDFLKIDVEGYELEVIKGASMTLVDNDFPPFIFEAWPDAWYREDRESLLAFVRGLGYKVYPISGTNNMYLASDHPLRTKSIVKEDTSVVKQEPQHNLDELRQKYESDSKEPLDLTWDQWHALAKHYRLASKHVSAYDCANKGLSVEHPEEKEYLLYEEISIVAFYINKKQEGFDACEKVILSREAPWNTHNLALSNEGFYMNMLPIKRKIPLRFNLPNKYTPSTASVVKHENGYRFNLRGVNYILTDKGGYISRHGDNVIRTVNFLLDTDKDFNILRSVEVEDKSGVQLYPKNVLGMEDIRLFRENNENYFFCTDLEVNDSRTPQICWGTYEEDGSVTRLVPLMAGEELKCEKNWMPFMQDGTIYFIYAMGPFQLYKLDQETGKVEELKKVQLGSRYIDDFRGSASPISYKDGWLCTIHQVYHSDPRKYFHRFIWLDRDFATIKYSRPFYFERVDIEFNLSLCHSDHGLIMTYSVHDSNSMIGIVDYDVVDEWINHYVE
jgi:FkbM family methyltransferase